jgi:Fe-Mn family superoxide dismutase
MKDDGKEGLSRREAIGALALGTGALAAGCVSEARAEPPSAPPGGPQPPAFAGRHEAAPLRFAPGSLHGISEQMIKSHHDNNYAGAVRNLNKIEAELAKVTAETPPAVVAALRDRELVFRNSVTLHELYFGNLGGSGPASGGVASVLQETYGTMSRWEEHFRATATGLGGGSGWVVLAWDLHRDVVFTQWSGNHSQAIARAAPLLVLDMYEHAYAIDYGADHAHYIDAFFQNVPWDEVNGRLDRARRAAAALRG